MCVSKHMLMSTSPLPLLKMLMFVIETAIGAQVYKVDEDCPPCGACSTVFFIRQLSLSSQYSHAVCASVIIPILSWRKLSHTGERFTKDSAVSGRARTGPRIAPASILSATKLSYLSTDWNSVFTNCCGLVHRFKASIYMNWLLKTKTKTTNQLLNIL